MTEPGRGDHARRRDVGSRQPTTQHTCPVRETSSAGSTPGADLCGIGKKNASSVLMARELEPRELNGVERSANVYCESLIGSAITNSETIQLEGIRSSTGPS